MKPITLHIYLDTDGVTAVHDGNGIFVSREEAQRIVKEVGRFYQRLTDDEIKRYTEWTKEAGRTKSNRGKKGYIYLIKSYDEFYKIGQATDPKSRMSGIQLPYKPKLIHTIFVTDMTWAERYLHRKFAHKRVDGEWFLLDRNDVDYIISLETLEPGLPEVEIIPLAR